MSRIVSWMLWPGLLTLCVSLTAWGWDIGRPTLVFNLTYVGLAVTLAVIERLLPYRKDWLDSDGQEGNDLWHTLVTKGFVTLMVRLVAISGLSEATVGLGASGFWPAHLPIALQVLLGIFIAEFGLYWAHRLAHTNGLLWRFHAVHHSVERLWFWNTGRFHIGDTVLSLLLSVPILIALGAPREVLLLTSTTTAYIGILTHCNVALRCGWLNYVFNTPEVHRWHHSIVIREGNNNFGENLMIYDLIFGTYFWPKDRQVGPIGISERMPRGFFGQLAAPFRWRRLQTPEGAATATPAQQS